jgi:error-prone DNA polymerase
VDRRPAEYAELHCRSYFSFQGGASSPEDLLDCAGELGYEALAITDVDGVYAAPRAYVHGAKGGPRPLVGAELTVRDDLAPRPSTIGPGAGHRIVLLCADERGYARLCKLLTTGRLRCDKGGAWVDWEELAADTAGLFALSGGRGGPIDAAWRRGDLQSAHRWATRLHEAFGDRAAIELTHHLAPGDDARVAALGQLARMVRLPAVAAQDSRFAVAADRPIFDVQTCIREKTTLARAGRRLAINGERHLQPPGRLRARFAHIPGAFERAAEIARELRFSMAELRYRFPGFELPPGETPFSYLYQLTTDGARERYRPMTPRAADQLARELAVIEKLDLAGYFLIVWDIVRFCRERGILCQGRGSAANSAVCYALGITAIDPVGMELLFERFLSEERDEMPDIDLDIANDRREEVIQYVYRRYGAERVAMTCNVISYHARSAIRDVGKAFGLSLEQVDRAAKSMDHHIPAWALPAAEDVALDPALRARLRRETGLDFADPVVRQAIDVARRMDGFPRHLGIHSGGMVITSGPTSEVVPVENATMAQRTVVQWDKDDLAAMGLIKIDLLGLGMLTALDHARRLIARFQGETIDLAKLPQGDPAVYDMICRADTVGVFQIESRAQMNMLPRMKPRTFYDLVIEVAIIRPGPIQGEMVHPYLRRRCGLEPVEFAHPSLEPVLARTLGVPLFQEQGMKLAIAAAGFTPGEADELRRAMGHKRSRARMEALSARLIQGMRRNGINGDVAERIYKQLCAFADYGFPESHAASFALIVYASCYLKRYYPAAFCAALLSAQPMGFYAPSTLVGDARRRGVEVRAPCARTSEWDTILVPREAGEPAVLLGLSSFRGLGEHHRARFEEEAARAPFSSIADVARRSGFPRAVLARMAAADAFRAFYLSRREALWQVAALPPSFGDAPLFERGDEPPAEAVAPVLPMSGRERLFADIEALGLSTGGHPMELLRPALRAADIPSAAELARTRDREPVTVAGLVIGRQRPGSANGMTFITLEDETGFTNLVLTPPTYERYRQVARGALLLRARGIAQREQDVINVLASHLEPLPLPADPSSLPRSRDFR